MRQRCTVAGVDTIDCGVSIFYPVTISLTQSGRTVQGTVTLNAIPVTVAGEVGTDDVLTLSGNGSGQNGSVTLNDWSTIDRDGVMTGRFTYALTPSYVFAPIGVSAILDGVVKPGVTKPAPIVPDPRLVLIARPGDARRYAPSPIGGAAGQTTYFACYALENYAPFSATLTLTITPIGSDGSEYAVEQTVYQGPPHSVSPRTTQSGCGGSANDKDWQRPLAPSYRLRMDYVYSDGASGFVESRAAVGSTVASWRSTDVTAHELSYSPLRLWHPTRPVQ